MFLYRVAIFQSIYLTNTDSNQQQPPSKAEMMWIQNGINSGEA